MTELTPEKFEELSKLLEVVEDAVTRAAQRYNARLCDKLEPFRLREPKHLCSPFYSREMWSTGTVVEITPEVVKVSENEVDYVYTSIPVGALCEGWEEFVDKLADDKMAEFAAQHRLAGKQLLARKKSELKALEKELGDA